MLANKTNHEDLRFNFMPNIITCHHQFTQPLNDKLNRKQLAEESIIALIVLINCKTIHIYKAQNVKLILKHYVVLFLLTIIKHNQSPENSLQEQRVHKISLVP